MKKKVLLAVIAITLTMSAIAQNPVQNLSNYLRADMLDKALENLNLAMADERYNKEAKTWLLRGNLYFAAFRCYDYINGLEVGMPDSIVFYLKGEPLADFKPVKTPDGKARKWEYQFKFDVVIKDNKVYSFNEPANGAYKAIAPSAVRALELAQESYLKTIELDPRFIGDLTFPTNPYEGLALISEGFFNMGVQHYNSNDFKVAYENFKSSHALRVSPLGIREPKDTMPGHYTVRAASYYVRQLSEAGNYEEAIKVANDARAIRPDDIELSLSEADAYLKMKDYLKTKELLEAIVVKQPNNAQLYFVIGNIYDQLSKDSTQNATQNTDNFDLTVKYYKKAIEVDPMYFEALFNLGTIYNNKAVDKLNIANKLPFGDSRYNGMIKEVDSLFNIALPYIEKAHEVNSQDSDPIRMLYSIYLRLKKNDMATEMKKKLDALKQE